VIQLADPNIRFGATDADQEALQAQLKSLQERMDAQGRLLESQASIFQAQADRLEEQEQTLAQQASKITEQELHIKALLSGQKEIGKQLGDTRRRQVDNDKLVSAVTAACQPSPRQLTANPPPRFNQADPGSSKALVPWLTCMDLWLTNGGVAPDDHQRRITHLLLNMTPATLNQAAEIRDTLKPEGAGPNWSPTVEAFVAELTVRWGGHPAQEAREKVESLRQKGTLEQYISTFEQLLSECKNHETFKVDPPQQVTFFLKGLDKGLGAATGTHLGSLTGKLLPEVIAAARSMNQIRRVMQTAEAEPSSPPRGSSQPKRKLKVGAPHSQSKKPKEHRAPPATLSAGPPRGQSKPNPSSTNPKDWVCYRCGERGHKITKCPQKQPSSKPGSSHKDKKGKNPNSEKKKDF
jgi:hypothetical protein